jgi:hypothetical protein
MDESQSQITISMPLHVVMGVKKKKKFYFNLNQYRNWHYQVSNNLKIIYKELVTPQIQGLSFKEIDLRFTLFKGSKRKMDRANVLSVHEKFFSDALVDIGCLEDDNDEFIRSTLYVTGGIDKSNPRVDIQITKLR